MAGPERRDLAVALEEGKEVMANTAIESTIEQLQERLEKCLQLTKQKEKEYEDTASLLSFIENEETQARAEASELLAAINLLKEI